MFFVLLRIDLFFPDSASLKAKRSELNAVKAGLSQRLGAAVSEVAHKDSWQRSTLAAALCRETERQAREAADGVERWLDSRLPQGFRMDRIVASWNDLESIG